MKMLALRELMETRQVSIYFTVIALAIIVAWGVPASVSFEHAINPALALMLFVTFLQVPVTELKQAFTKGRFLAALLCTNFIVMPCIVFGLIQFLPHNTLLRLGVLMVLLTPCIDYVVTFSHLGKADAKLLLAATPVLLILQMLLLPIYLATFLGQQVAELIHVMPFIHAFIWLILLPFILAALLQQYLNRNKVVAKLVSVCNLLPVPSTAVVLFVVILTVVPQLRLALDDVLYVVPIYIAFAIIAPFIGLYVGQIFKLNKPAKRAVAFSSATRNSLVILPLALAIPDALPLLPAVIVTQTFIELLSEIIYVHLFSHFDKN